MFNVFKNALRGETLYDMIQTTVGNMNFFSFEQRPSLTT